MSRIWWVYMMAFIDTSQFSENFWMAVYGCLKFCYKWFPVGLWPTILVIFCIVISVSNINIKCKKWKWCLFSSDSSLQHNIGFCGHCCKTCERMQWCKVVSHYFKVTDRAIFGRFPTVNKRHKKILFKVPCILSPDTHLWSHATFFTDLVGVVIHFLSVTNVDYAVFILKGYSPVLI